MNLSIKIAVGIGSIEYEGKCVLNSYGIILRVIAFDI